MSSVLALGDLECVFNRRECNAFVVDPARKEVRKKSTFVAE